MARTTRHKSATSKAPKVSRNNAKFRAVSKGKGNKKTKLSTKAKTVAPVEQEHKALFFWDKSDPVSGFLSPWYEVSFEEDGINYQSVGHYIMAAKARHFNDQKTLDKILASKSSDEHKALGNNVKGFKHARWQEYADVAASRANERKFLQCPNSSALRKRLLPFVDHELVYASPTDDFFGIGLSAEEAGDPKNLKDRKRWGSNLFGHSLWWCKRKTWLLAHPDAAASASEKVDVSVFDTPGSGYFIAW